MLPPQQYQDWYNVPRDHLNWGKAVNQVSTMIYHHSCTITVPIVLGWNTSNNSYHLGVFIGRPWDRSWMAYRSSDCAEVQPSGLYQYGIWRFYGMSRELIACSRESRGPNRPWTWSLAGGKFDWIQRYVWGKDIYQQPKVNKNRMAPMQSVQYCSEYLQSYRPSGCVRPWVFQPYSSCWATPVIQHAVVGSNGLREILPHVFQAPCSKILSQDSSGPIYHGGDEKNNCARNPTPSWTKAKKH